MRVSRVAFSLRSLFISRLPITMCPRGPLQDLPLEQFLPPDPNIAHTSRPNKRPLESPGRPSLYSPAKRRILNNEGIFSPEKTMKSPPFRSTQDYITRFSQVLTSTESPAKRLEFGSPSLIPSDPR